MRSLSSAHRKLCCQKEASCSLDRRLPANCIKEQVSTRVRSRSVPSKTAACSIEMTRRRSPKSAELQRRRTWALIFFFQAEDGIRYLYVTGVQTCALPI